MIQKWYGLIRVVQPDGSPVEGASIMFRDADGGLNPVFSSVATTNASGYAPADADPSNFLTWPEITEYQVNNDGLVCAKTPHSITVTYGSSVTKAIFSWNSRCQIAEIVLNRPPTADAGTDQIVEQTALDGVEVTLDGSGSTDADADVLTYAWDADGDGQYDDLQGVTPALTLTLGTYEIGLQVTDPHGASSKDTVLITVQDTTPPVIHSITPDPSYLWPPNHKMVPIVLSANITDACDSSPGFRIVSVESSKDHFSGHNDVNWQITGAHSVDLRAELDGSNTHVYTIGVEAVDAEGNASFGSCEVIVDVIQRKCTGQPQQARGSQGKGAVDQRQAGMQKGK